MKLEFTVATFPEALPTARQVRLAYILWIWRDRCGENYAMASRILSITRRQLPLLVEQALKEEARWSPWNRFEPRQPN